MVSLSICQWFFFKFLFAFKRILHMPKKSELPHHIYPPSVPVPWTLLPFWYFSPLKHQIPSHQFSRHPHHLLDPSCWHTVISSISKQNNFFFFFIMLCPKASTPFLGSLLQQTPQTFSCFHMNPLTSTSNVNIVTLWSIFCFHLSWPSSSIWHS